eukprot:scaffold439826_cov17-Prasinocladus_malaysianus.AAC.1
MHVAMLVWWDSPVDLKSRTCGSSLRADERDELCDPLMPASNCVGNTDKWGYFCFGLSHYDIVNNVFAKKGNDN